MEKSENIKKIEEHLAKIGYKIVDHGCGHWGILDNNDEHTDWCIFGEVDTRIYRDPQVSFQHNVEFYLKGCELYQLEDNCVGFNAKGNKDVFLQFYNRKK